MPLYGYHCAKCDRDVELLIGADDPAACPHCGNPKMARLMSRVAPPGKSRGMVKSARAQAAREGHFSNYSRSERRS
jgi:putative FmdB family regulatory protein